MSLPPDPEQTDQTQPGPRGLPPQPELPESEPEQAGAQGRIGYGRYGRYTPLALAVLMILGLIVIAVIQARGASDEPSPPRPGQLPGTAAPEVELTLLDGTPVALADYRGSVVLVNFWASWCEPCRTEIPEISAFADSRPDVVVVGVSAKDPELTAREFAAEVAASYPLALGTEEIENVYPTFGLPATYVIDERGVIIEVFEGQVDAEMLATALN